MIRTQQEIAKLPKFNKASAANAYRLNNFAYIDNKHGFEATAAHADIKNRGFINRMPIEQYLELCGYQQNEEAIAKVAEEIRSGRGVASPRLFIDIDGYMSVGYGRCKALDYTGGNICAALMRFEIFEIEVHFVTLGYSMRNIEDPSNFFNWVGSGIQGSEDRIFTDVLSKVIVL